MDKLGECLEKLIPSCLKKISYHMVTPFKLSKLLQVNKELNVRSYVNVAASILRLLPPCSMLNNAY